MPAKKTRIAEWDKAHQRLVAMIVKRFGAQCAPVWVGSVRRGDVTTTYTPEKNLYQLDVFPRRGVERRYKVYIGNHPAVHLGTPGHGSSHYKDVSVRGIEWLTEFVDSVGGCIATQVPKPR